MCSRRGAAPAAGAGAVAIANASQAWRIRWLGKSPEPLDQQTDRDLLDKVGVDHAGARRRILVRFEDDLTGQTAP